MPKRRTYEHGFGSYEAGNLPWRNQQLFDFAERVSEEMARKKYKPLPSVVAPKSKRQQKIARHVDNLFASYTTKRQSPNNPYSLAQKEINQALNTKTHAGIKPALEAAARSPFDPQDAQFMTEFEQKYGDIGKAVLDEMNENYLTHLAPKVSGQAIQGGYHNNYNTVQHQKNAALRGLHKDVARQLSHLKARGLEHGLEEAHKHKVRGLEAAQLGANVQEKEKEAAMKGAQALQDAERGQHIHDLSVMDQQKKQAQEEQAHNEALLRETHERAREQQEFRTHKLAQEAELIMGLPATHVSQVQKPVAPAPVNPYEIGSGVLGQMVGMMYPQQQPQKVKKGGAIQQNAFHDFQKLVAKAMVKRKKGGSIKAYAPGGAVSYEPNAGMTPEVEQQLAILQQMQRAPNNAIGHAFSNMGAHILSKVGSGDRPFASFGEGLQKFNATRQAHEQHAQEMQAKQITLLSSINQSRHKQMELVQNYEHNKALLAEQTRLHNAQIGHYGVHNKLLEAQANQLTGIPGTSGYLGAAGSSGYLPKGIKETTSMQEQAKADQEYLTNLRKQKTEIEKAYPRAKQLESLFNELDTGPVAAAINDLPVVGPSLTDIIPGLHIGDKAKTATLNPLLEGYAIAKEAALPGGSQNVTSLKGVQKSKGSKSFPQSTNKSIIASDLKEYEVKLAEAEFVEDFLHNKMGTINDARKAWQQKKKELFGKDYLNEIEKSAQNKAETHSSNKSSKASSLSTEELKRIAGL